MPKIIDVHIHSNFSDEIMKKGASYSEVSYSLTGLKKEMQSANVQKVFSIAIKFFEGNLSKNFQTPLIDSEEEKDILKIASINPFKINKNSLKSTEMLLKQDKIKGLKIYLGYYHLYPSDKRYSAFYNLAAKYDVPVIFHTGDNYSLKAKLKFAHPLNVDEVAVDFPKTKFVLAHFGNPWIIDGAEVVFKNDNVYADLSGWAIGNLKEIHGVNTESFKSALDYCGYDKIMYGSDWPLVQMKPYINLIEKMIPSTKRNKVFYKNAKKLFKL
ncbi:MAG: amidohydrolase family protein [archaeon]